MNFVSPKAFKPPIPEFATKMVSFQFDDGNDSDYIKAYAYLASKGLTPSATSNLNTNTIGNASRLTWANVATMKAAGWSFQCHTADHYNLTTLTEAQLNTQFQLVDTAFRARGWNPPKYHVYPFGLWNASVRDIALLYREVMVLDGVPGTNTTAFLGKTIRFKGSYGDIRNDETFNLRKAEVDSIVAGQYDWITFLGHSVEDNPPIEQDYGWKTSYFQAFVDYVIAQGLQIVSIEHGHMIQKMAETRWPTTFIWKDPIV